MRSCGAARASAQADHLPPRNALPLLYPDFRKMQVKREQSLTVVEDHAIAFEIQRSSQQDGSGIGRGNGRAGRYRIIQSLMHALHFAVKGPSRAEDIGDETLPPGDGTFPTTRAPDQCVEIRRA